MKIISFRFHKILSFQNVEHNNQSVIIELTFICGNYTRKSFKTFNNTKWLKLGSIENSEAHAGVLCKNARNLYKEKRRPKIFVGKI